MLAIAPDVDRDGTAGDVILDRVVAEVVEHLAQQLLHALHLLMLAQQPQRHAAAACRIPQRLRHTLGQRIEVDRRARERRALVEPGQVHHIVDERDHAA